MLLTEYNEAKQLELSREEGRAEGRMEGRAEGRMEGREEGRAEGITLGIAKGTINTLIALVRKGLLEKEAAAEMADLPLIDFEALLEGVS